jgi:hypothetical protein
MLEIEKIKKAPVMSRRMSIINYLCRQSGLDIYYLFGLLNMYNEKNKGRWFWQKASFTGVLKDDFDSFNSYMDKFSSQFHSFDKDKIETSLKEAREKLVKLVTSLETSMFLNRDIDGSSVRAYLDDNIKRLIDQNLKGVKN